MPLQSSMNKDEKDRVKNILTPTCKIFTATVARLYYAYPDLQNWSYSGEQGGLAFVKDKGSGLYYFKLVDLQGTRGILWEHELYEDFTLNEDRPFFHSFAGDECMIGIVYSDESEATSFLKMVNKKKAAFGKTRAGSSKKKSKKAAGGKIDKSLISGPQEGSFRHVSHMGYDAEKGFITDNVDPSWLALMEQLEKHGIDRSLIAENMDFIKGFVRDAQSKPAAKGGKKGPPPPAPAPRKKPPVPPPRRGIHGQSDSVSSLPMPVEPSPAPPTAPSRPPPPTRRPSSPTEPVAPPAPVRTTPPPPPPPVAPPRPSVAPPTPPPPPPGRPSAVAPPPPPLPPPPPVVGGGVPPPLPPPPPSGGFSGPPPAPPPPPPGVSGGAPPPPPPPAPSGGVPAAAIPAPQPGRGALLASIEGKGIHSLRKTGGPVHDASAPTAIGRTTSPTPGDDGSSVAGSVAAGAAAAGGGDLAAALAAALTQRNKKLGDSDDDDDDEEEWD